MKDNERKIQEKFQQLMERTETDPKLKEEVFDTISMIENVASIVDLFTTKFIMAESTFLSDMIPEDKKNSSKV